ncbi:PTS cellobiose transporter subunit IIC [Enterococcus sp. JM4C]|nr:PTS cellobiose transporter subunit IIC [Enterococcus sp. JM4C]
MKLSGIAGKAAENKPLKAISSGMMMTLPLTLGASFFMIIASFPVPAFTQWLNDVGIAPQMKAVSGATINILALFMAFTIAYSLGKLLDLNPGISGVFSLAAFLVLMPQVIGEGDTAVAGFASSYLGSSGIFIAIIVSISITYLYKFLYSKDRLVMKLPDSVPSNVSQSFEPLLIGLVIFVAVFLVRLLFSYTSYENFFEFINQIVAAPLTSVGGSVPMILLVYTLSNLLFFFGIHPNPIYAIMKPIQLTMILAAVNSIDAGTSIKNFDSLVAFDFIYTDGTGNTLCLLLAIIIFGKSVRYKSLSKLAFIPNLFNINEPVVFGLPIMLNPILFVPYFLSSFVSAGIGVLAAKVGILSTSSYQAGVALGMPWTMPKIIQRLFVYGWSGVVVTLLTMVVGVMVYYPFFKQLDKKEYELELASSTNNA